MPDDALTDDIDPRNYADDEATAKRAKDYLTEMCDQARAERVQLQDEWRSLYNIWDEFPDVKWYNGRAEIYYPVGHRATERLVARQMARLFPMGDDFIDVKSIPPGEDDQDEVQDDTEAAKALIWYDLNQHLHIRRRMPVFLRQRTILGTSVLETDYITGSEAKGPGGRKQFRLVKGKDPGTLGKAKTRSKFAAGPTGRVVDLFTWYAWPASIDSLDEAVIQFEDELVTWGQLQEWKTQKRFAFEDGEMKRQAGRAPTKSIWERSERLQQRGVSEQQAAKMLFVLTRAYGEWPLDEEDGEEIPCEFTMVGDLVVMVRQNQQWHQQSPYHLSRMMPYVSELYGRGPIHFLKTLQYQINDTANQTLDGMSYALNPITKVDPLAVPDPALLQYRPGALWPVAPNSAQAHVTQDTHRMGFDAIRQLWEVAQELTGAQSGGQFLPTVGLARGAQTATGMAIISQGGDIDLALDVTTIEEEFLEPLCERLDLMEQQFLPEGVDRILRAMGPKAIPLLQNGMRMRREQMLGTRTYTWTGGVVSEQREQFQKVGPSLFEIFSKLPASQDYTIDLAAAAEMLIRSFGFPAEQFIRRKKPGAGFDPSLEHAVMRAGHPIDPMPGEAYMAHLVQHNAAVKQAMTEGWFDRLSSHIAKTVILMRENPAAVQGQPGNGMPPGGQPANIGDFLHQVSAGMPANGGNQPPPPRVQRVERDPRGLVSRIITEGQP